MIIFQLQKWKALLQSFTRKRFCLLLLTGAVFLFVPPPKETMACGRGGKKSPPQNVPLRNGYVRITTFYDPFGNYSCPVLNTYAGYYRPFYGFSSTNAPMGTQYHKVKITVQAKNYTKIFWITNSTPIDGLDWVIQIPSDRECTVYMDHREPCKPCLPAYCRNFSTTPRADWDDYDDIDVNEDTAYMYLTFSGADCNCIP